MTGAPIINVVWSTLNPGATVAKACTISMKGKDAQEVDSNEKLIRYIYTANHSSPLEHAVISMDIGNISRACLDQLTRHRMGSFTTSSTHYQNHSDYQISMDANDEVKLLMDEVFKMYEQLAASSFEQARQILPLGVESRCIWTVNARSLANFLNLRLCKRNVPEMVTLASSIQNVAVNWFPELFTIVGPDCKQTQCTQGHMRAGICRAQP